MNEISKNKYCSNCNKAFTCGDVTDKCWCNQFPAIMELDWQSDCLCPVCLKKIVASKISKFVNSIQTKDLYKYDLLRFQKSELIESIDYNINESGKWVFTAWYHLKRGYCCKNDCLNCPFGYVKDK